MSTAQINGIEIYYEEHGDPKAEPLLLIMGFMTNCGAMPKRSTGCTCGSEPKWAPRRCGSWPPCCCRWPARWAASSGFSFICS